MDKKIYIITLHRVYNFGSALQAYATQKIFEKYSNDVCIIDYRRPQDILINRIIGSKSKQDGIIKKIRHIIYVVLRFFSILLKECTIGRFLRKRLKMTKQIKSYKKLKELNLEADIYVTGSDQTWNSKYNNGIDPAYYLQFVSNKKNKISFCASIGNVMFSEYEKNITKDYLKSYHAISVREPSAKILLENIGLKDVVCLIDPTLQITKKEWLSLASNRLVKEKYLLLMLLYNEDENATEIAKNIADRKGLKLVKLSWEFFKPQNVDKLMTHRSPEDFLSLFYYADYIVTNSFHGLCFSINFEKEFVAIRRNEFNTRLEGLLSLFGLSNRMVTINNFNNVIDNNIDYNIINNILDSERKKADLFLSKSLNNIIED